MAQLGCVVLWTSKMRGIWLTKRRVSSSFVCIFLYMEASASFMHSRGDRAFLCRYGGILCAWKRACHAFIAKAIQTPIDSQDSTGTAPSPDRNHTGIALTN